ncbi:hypothetical protein HDU93_007876 [Gonapodya sp. JEL0774]|nr:hypothetical protein HDU93_007876 [Gonapodya sp. JEL0774]
MEESDAILAVLRNSIVVMLAGVCIDVFLVSQDPVDGVQSALAETRHFRYTERHRLPSDFHPHITLPTATDPSRSSQDSSWSASSSASPLTPNLLNVSEAALGSASPSRSLSASTPPQLANLVTGLRINDTPQPAIKRDAPVGSGPSTLIEATTPTYPSSDSSGAASFTRKRQFAGLRERSTALKTPTSIPMMLRLDQPGLAEVLTGDRVPTAAEASESPTPGSLEPRVLSYKGADGGVQSRRETSHLDEHPRIQLEGTAGISSGSNPATLAIPQRDSPLPSPSASPARRSTSSPATTSRKSSQHRRHLSSAEPLDFLADVAVMGSTTPGRKILDEGGDMDADVAGEDPADDMATVVAGAAILQRLPSPPGAGSVRSTTAVTLPPVGSILPHSMLSGRVYAQATRRLSHGALPSFFPPPPQQQGTFQASRPMVSSEGPSRHSADPHSQQAVPVYYHPPSPAPAQMVSPQSYSANMIASPRPTLYMHQSQGSTPVPQVGFHHGSRSMSLSPPAAATRMQSPPSMSFLPPPASLPPPPPGYVYVPISALPQFTPGSTAPYPTPQPQFRPPSQQTAYGHLAPVILGANGQVILAPSAQPLMVHRNGVGLSGPSSSTVPQMMIVPNNPATAQGSLTHQQMQQPTPPRVSWALPAPSSTTHSPKTGPLGGANLGRSLSDGQASHSALHPSSALGSDEVSSRKRTRARSADPAGSALADATPPRPTTSISNVSHQSTDSIHSPATRSPQPPSSPPPLSDAPGSTRHRNTPNTGSGVSRSGSARRNRHSKSHSYGGPNAGSQAVVPAIAEEREEDDDEEGDDKRKKRVPWSTKYGFQVGKQDWGGGWTWRPWTTR